MKLVDVVKEFQNKLKSYNRKANKIEINAEIRRSGDVYFYISLTDDQNYNNSIYLTPTQITHLRDMLNNMELE